MVFSGFRLAVVNRVGKMLAEGKINLATFISKNALYIGTTIGILIACLMKLF